MSLPSRIDKNTNNLKEITLVSMHSDSTHEVMNKLWNKKSNKLLEKSLKPLILKREHNPEWCELCWFIPGSFTAPSLPPLLYPLSFSAPKYGYSSWLVAIFLTKQVGYFKKKIFF